ncbi:hypothetical protein [Sinomonas sp. ASV322]|uniref:DUF7224 domain-containing protein n=1 Tax=Sinomonas sp. ASV322 TaxID=3041920 RepID=UPI0027DCC98E|nr:hypothetical protein [Sinomonas sp. ASV322]MDQ4502647.1 hypothetical protein [Sinomonas sp. ASV322]
MSVLPLPSRPALWLVFPGLILVWVYAALYISDAAIRGHWVAAMSNAALFLLFSCGLAALSAAIEGSRDRSGKLGDLAVVRSSWHIAAQRLWPSLLAGATVQTVGTLFLASAAFGAPGRPPWELPVAYVAIVFFHASLGYALGRFLPAIAAIPLSMLSSYGWLGFTWSVPYFPLRHLAGPALASCCGPASELNPLAVWAPIAFSIPAGVLLLALVALNPPVGRAERARVGRRRARAAMAVASGLVACLAVVTACSLFLARNVGAFAYQDRPESELECSGQRPRICLFPEQLASSDPRPVLAAAFSRLEAAGMPLFMAVNAGVGDSNPTDAIAVVAVGIRSSEAELIHAAASAYTAPLTGIDCGATDYRPWLRAYGILSAWLELEASKGVVAPERVRAGVARDTLDDLDHLQARPLGEQREWIRSALESLKRCEAVSPDDAP